MSRLASRHEAEDHERPEIYEAAANNDLWKSYGWHKQGIPVDHEIHDLLPTCLLQKASSIDESGGFGSGRTCGGRWWIRLEMVAP